MHTTSLIQSGEAMKLEIEVTRTDIAGNNDGRTGSSRSRTCPLARAISRKLPAGQMARVGMSTGVVENNLGDTVGAFDLPLEAKEARYCFDADRTVKPFTFHIWVEEPKLR